MLLHRALLKASDWNVEQAVNAVVGGGEEQGERERELKMLRYVDEKTALLHVHTHTHTHTHTYTYTYESIFANT